MDSIPAFPHFVRLSLTHKDVVRTVTKKFPPYSDFNFVSLFTWNTDETLGVSMLNENLIVRFSDYASDDIFLSLLGTHKLAETLEALFAYCHERGYSHQLQLIPHSVIESLPTDLTQKYEVHEDRDNHDYIMSTKAIASGAVARKKRAAAHRFERRHQDRIQCRVLDLGSRATIEAIQNVMTQWAKTRTNSPGQDKETIAIERCLRHTNELDLKAYGTFVDDHLAAFIILELMSGPTAMMHYGKSDHSFPDIFDFTKVEAAKYLHSIGVEYMNFEQDMGIEGLRRDKEAYLPVDYLKKFSISEKEPTS
jgi:uncharacterized protein